MRRARRKQQTIWRKLWKASWLLLRIGIGLALGAGVYDRVVMSLVVRHGTDTIVPAVVGRRLQESERFLLDANLRPGTIQEVTDLNVPAGEVVNQEPTAGSTVRRNRAVNLLVSTGAPSRRIPNLIGTTRRLAQIELSRMGLRLGSATVVNVPGTVEGEILATRPQPGSLPAGNGRVDLLVSGGSQRERFVMPDLRGVRISEAARRLRVIGVSIAYYERDSQIWRQDPAPGQAVRSGTPSISTSSVLPPLQGADPMVAA